MSYTHNKSNNGQNNTQHDQQTRFSNTYLQRDIRAWRSEILIGENYTSNDVFDSISFSGVKLNSSENMLPLSLRGFSPVVTIIASSNARISISQNGNVVFQTYVATGLFRIDNLSQPGLGGPDRYGHRGGWEHKDLDPGVFITVSDAEPRRAEV